MALTQSQVKKELRESKAERDKLNERIEHLAGYLATFKDEITPSARGGIDIRPVVVSIFEKNGNKAMKVKEITDAVARNLPDVDRRIIEKKMGYAKGNKGILKKAIGEDGAVIYGKYQLKTENP